MNSSIKENIKNVYKKYANSFDEKIAPLDIYNEAYDFLIERLQNDSSILDLGCGPGNVSAYLKRYKPELSITGVDISEEMIDIAKTGIQDGTFIVGDIFDVTPNTQFHCVVCAFAIPYLSLLEVERLAKIISQRLTLHGMFFISFMDGNTEGFEKTSFTGNDELFVYYHPRQLIYEILHKQSLSVAKTFEVDYPEEDGSITKDIVYIGNKTV